MLWAVAAKVYTKAPSELLPADSYYLPSVEYIQDLVAEFPLSSHNPGNPLTATASASSTTRQSTADAQQSLAGTVVPLVSTTVATAALPPNTAHSPGSTCVSTRQCHLLETGSVQCTTSWTVWRTSHTLFAQRTAISRSWHLDLAQHSCTIADFTSLCEPKACGGYALHVGSKL